MRIIIHLFLHKVKKKLYIYAELLNIMQDVGGRSTDLCNMSQIQRDI